MKSLRKALNILEYISCQDGHAVTPSELAKNCKINTTSCVRMLQTLSDRGYLQQVSRKQGYVSGPALVTLGCRESIYKELVNASTSPLKKLSKQIHGLVNISILYRDKRYLLYHYGASPGIQMHNFITPPWIYNENATERLLLAAAQDEDRNRIIKEIGLPEGQNSLTEFKQELDDIYKKGYVKFWSEGRRYWIAGRLVVAPSYPNAAIGFGVETEAEADMAIEYTKETAEEIKRNLQPNQLFPC